MTFAATLEPGPGSRFFSDADAGSADSAAADSPRAARHPEPADCPTHQSSSRAPAQNASSVMTIPAKISTTQWCLKYTVPKTSPETNGTCAQANQRW